MGFMKPLMLLVVIPVFGFLVSILVLNSVNKEIAEAGSNYTVKQLCAPELLIQSPELQPFCKEISPIIWMQYGSILSAAAAVLLLLSFVLFASIAGKNRNKIAKIFPSLVFVTLIVLAGLVVVQGAILTYGAYVAETFAIQRVHLILIAGIGIGALVGGTSLISSSFKLAKKQTHDVLGKILSPGTNPDLFSLVDKIADTLGAHKPEHIVVGLEPNFYVTSADVNVLGENKKLKGQTLYMSLPLARILTLEEIKSIIGHELGHFRGDDTYYSLKFSPVYSGLTHAVSSMGNPSKVGVTAAIATFPAAAVLSYIIDVFHTNVSTISREREFAADKAASEVAEPKALASSLLKIGLYASAWAALENKVVARMQEGKITRNLSQLFYGTAKYDVNEKTVPEVIDSIAQQTVSHPTDSHPTTANRIAELGLSMDEIEHDLLRMPENSCITLFNKVDEIEEQLTVLQQQYYVHLGVKVPERDNNQLGATILAAFGAHMVVADGKVEVQEIDKAESIGLKMSASFDYIEFREFCSYPESIPTMDDLFAATKDIQPEGKAEIIEYLEKIANADNEVSSEEKVLLDLVIASFS